MVKKIVVIFLCLFMLAGTSFAFISNPADIKKIEYDQLDVWVTFTDTAGWTGRKIMAADSESTMKVMLSILLTAAASGKQVNLEIVSGEILGVYLIND